MGAWVFRKLLDYRCKWGNDGIWDQKDIGIRPWALNARPERVNFILKLTHKNSGQFPSCSVTFFSPAVDWGQLEYLLHRAVVTTPWVDKWEQGLLYVKRPVLHGHCHDYVTILSALTYLCPRACPGHTSQSWIQKVARRVIVLQFPRLLPCQGHQGLCQGLLHSVFPVNSL